MPDELNKTETVEETPATTTETVEEEAFDKDRAMATIKKLREEARKAEKLQKQVEHYQQDEAKRKEAELSEMEKLQKQLEVAQSRAAKLERESAQRKAAEDAVLPVAFADRIRGETPEEMLADAKSLLEAMPKQPAKPNVRPTNVGGNASVTGETDEQRRKRLLG